MIDNENNLKLLGTLAVILLGKGIITQEEYDTVWSVENMPTAEYIEFNRKLLTKYEAQP